MTVDGRELHERINGIERHEVHAERREEVLKGLLLGSPADRQAS
jgi:hypothetical protein